MLQPSVDYNSRIGSARN